MKIVVTGLILLGLTQSSISNAAGLCENLFTFRPEAQQPQIQVQQQTTAYAEVGSARVEVTKVSDENSHSKLHVEQLEFSKDPNQAVLELIRYLVNGRTFALEDKNVLIKNKMTLGIPLKNGYTFLVTYESKSNEYPLFVIEDKITLLSPSNKEFKLTDVLISPTEMKIAKSDFDMPEYFEKDLLVNLKIPLSIDATILAKLDGYAKYFEHIPKEKLRKIFAQQSPVKRNMLLQIGRAKSMLNEAFLKSPFKIAAQAVFMAAIINGSGHIMTNYFTNPLPPSSTTQVKLGKGALINNNDVSWVLETKDNANQPHTYIAFSGEIKSANLNNQPVQYVIFEVDPVKYAKLIAQMKQNQKPIEGP